MRRWRARRREAQARPRRANQVDELTAVLIAVGGGTYAATAGAAPTGHSSTDLLLVLVAVAAVVYAAASAPWWALAATAVVSLAIAADPGPALLAVVSYALASWIGWRKRHLSDARALAAALALNALIRAQFDPWLGATAIVGIGAAVFLAVAGIRRRPRTIRHVGWMVGGAAAGIALVATAGFAIEAGIARGSVDAGRREAELAVDAIEHGEFATGAAHLERASAAFRRAARHLDRPWAAAASIVPGIAQQHAATADLSAEGAGATAAAAAALARVDVDALRVSSGQIDLAAVEALAAPVGEVRSALAGLAGVVDDARSPWLLPAVADGVDELSIRLDDVTASLDETSAAVHLAPAMLGADAPRRYLLLFTTPAEARGLGGFPGNYAELSVDGGRIEMSEFGRVSDLEAAGVRQGARVTGPDGFLARYGQFGYNADGHGLVGPAAWRNLTMSPNFPWVAEVAAELYPQATGRTVDGVIAVDPYVMAALLGYTGPISLESVGTTVDSTNGASFVLLDQYRVAPDHTARVDALEEMSRKTVESLLAGSMPDPVRLGRDLGALARAGRLAMWTMEPDEQALLADLELLDALPALDGADGWGVTVSNAGGSKIDTFLDRSFAYESTTDTRGSTTSTLQVELINGAPATGLPDYVIGNVLGMPTGTSRLYVSVYSALPLASATIDGQPIELTTGEEAGWHVASGFVELPAGVRAELTATFAGVVADPDRVVTWTQPLARPPAERGPANGP